jgi:hypothetical protein
MKLFFWRRSLCELAGWLALGLAAVLLRADEPVVSPIAAGNERLTVTFEGIECEFSPGQEELARLLAVRFAAHNARTTAAAAQPSPAAPTTPLSAAEMQMNRAAYLGRIAAQLGLQKPTGLQEECYDEFVRNYALTMEASETARSMFRRLCVVKRVAIWPSDELFRRLKGGEAVRGLRYDPETESFRGTFGFSTKFVDEKLKALAQSRNDLKAAYRMSIETENGARVYRGEVTLNPTKGARTQATPSPAPAPAAAPTSDPSMVFPVIVHAKLGDESPTTLAKKLWEDSDPSIRAMLDHLARIADQMPRTDPHLAAMILHETTEIGVVDHYMRGPDRRWFCDGVANYVAWRVVRDLHGPAAANAVYNLPEQLAMHAAVREQVDLRQWPAAETQTDDEPRTPLNGARYAFATRAVFLMNDRAGEDILPRLFGEIRKTAAKKTSIKTVEKAWKKLTKTPLDDVLAAAVAPLPPSATPPPAVGAPTAAKP